MYKVTVSQKGQIIIPSKIRKKLHIKKGTKLYIYENGREILIQPETPKYIDSLAGMINTDEKLSDYLIKERQIESSKFLKKIEKWLK